MENKGYPGGFTVENQSNSQPPLAFGGQIQPSEAPPYNPQPFPQNQHQFPHQQPVYGPQNNAYQCCHNGRNFGKCPKFHSDCRWNFRDHRAPILF